jgi:delta1-piperideine-2-carboxylate reductase
MNLQEIYDLANNTLKRNGCNDQNANAVSKIIQAAEQDGSTSHGLFRLPGYIKALKSGKVNGDAVPKIIEKSPTIIQVDGENCFAPLAQEVGLPVLAKATKKFGIAALSLTRVHHFAALWHETEYLTEQNLVGIACTAYMPNVAPAGSKKAFFGTNPLSFAWPRPGKRPIVYDMATAAMAMGEVQIAARDGHSVPQGTGLDKKGEASIDPKEIAKGVLLPFGGYKGSAIALMVELLAAGLTGDNFNYEAAQTDNKDGGPPQGGEMIIALSPEIIDGPDWINHCEKFAKKLESLEGVRIPGQRRHRNRENLSSRNINQQLLMTIKNL